MGALARAAQKDVKLVQVRKTVKHVLQVILSWLKKWQPIWCALNASLHVLNAWVMPIPAHLA